MAPQGFSSRDPFKHRDTAAGFGARLSGRAGAVSTGGTSSVSSSRRRSSSRQTELTRATLDAQNKAKARAASKAKAISAAKSRAADAKRRAEAISKGRIARARTEAEQRKARRLLDTRQELTTVERARQLRGNIPKKIKPLAKKAGSKFLNALDFVLGGDITEMRIDNKEREVNAEIESFNKRFGERELTEEQAQQAKVISSSIEGKQIQILKERDNLASSVRSKIQGFANINARETSKEKQARIVSNKPTVKKKETQLKKVEEKLKTKNSKLENWRLKNERDLLKSDIGMLKVGGRPRVIAGTVPIVPAAGIPGGVTNIKFIGKQRTLKNGKILTDIVFKTSKGRTGVARGLTVTKGKNSASAVIGRSGKKVFRLPSGKKKFIDLRTFIGREDAATIRSTVSIGKKVDILRNAKKVGTVNKIKTNVKALKQLGLGRVKSVKGKQFIKPSIKFPSGKISRKLAKGISTDDFASLSAIFTKKDLSLIIGNTITGAGAKSNFIGIIKGSRNAGKVFSISQKQQYAAALKKVIGSTSAALAKTQKIKGLTKATSLAATAKIAVDTARKRPTPRRLRATVKKKPTVKPTAKPTAKPIAKPKAIVRTKGKSKAKPSRKQRQLAKPKQKPKTKPVTRQKPTSKRKPKSRQRQKQDQITRQRQRQAQRQRLKQVQKQKQLAKFKAKSRVAPFSAKPIRGLVPVVSKKKKIGKKTKRKTKRKQAYKVTARPVKKRKGQKKPKLIKVNKVPLSKSDAEDLKSFIVDTSLSRTGRTSKTKGKPKKPKLKFPKKYAKRTFRKFRKYRVVKGKKVPLPRGKVIERRRRLLDTRQEKRDITLKRRIKQITIKKKPVKKKVSRKKSTKRKPTPKRKNIKRRKSK